MGRSREEAVRINRPLGKKRIKHVLKKIAQQMNHRQKEIVIGFYILADFLDDGVINGSIVTMILS